MESKYGYSGVMYVSENNNPRKLYNHQEKAIKALNKTTKEEHHKGLLVIPTGGGKTFTGVYYILNQIINNNKKVLWIAHRHELLNQTLETIDRSRFKDVMPDRQSFRYRIVSGKHDRPVNIQSDDDIIIASKDSLIKGKDYIKKWIKENQNNICLVIDEAHHAVAKTYRDIINLIEEYSDEWSKILGLTATPIRTSEKEKGLLKKIFKDDIIYSIDLNTLISRGILAKPYFSEKNTYFALKKELSSKELDYIRRSGNLPSDVAESIVKNIERNNIIVEEYIKNRKLYGKTLVFAINIMHAIELNALFNSKGVKSEFVISSLNDASTGVTISNEENDKKIKAFRNGELDVLVNVNILTEGTDIPNIQSIFLTRQTTSKILLNQMIGRGLRGVNAGGTKDAYIVSFVDNWKYRINWISPRELDAFDGNNFYEVDAVKKKYEERAILLKVIEEFTVEANEIVDNTRTLNSTKEFAVIGGYRFKIISEVEDNEEKECTIIVFNNLSEAYEEFLLNINYVYDELNLYNDFSYGKLDMAAEFIKKEFFSGYDEFSLNMQDIKDILEYYYLEGIVPELTELEVPIIPNIPTYEDQPKIIVDKIKYEKMSLAEIRRVDEKYWRKLRNDVFEKFKDEDGIYVSATGLYRNNSKWFFQIDHIIPISRGGKTVLENLQLLTRWENKIKGNKEINIDELKYLLNNNFEKLTVQELEKQLEYVYFDEDNIHKSMEIIKRLQEIDRDNGSAYRILANIKLDEEKYKSAIINANKALAINDRDTFAIYVKGEAYYYRENYKEAIKWFEISLREYGDNEVDLLKYLGDCNYHLKKKEIALSYYMKVLEYYSEKDEFLSYIEFMIGEIYFSKRKYDIAKNHYLKSLECDDSDHNVVNSIGVCYHRLKNESEALKYYFSAHKMDKECKLYLNNINSINNR